MYWSFGIYMNAMEYMFIWANYLEKEAQCHAVYAHPQLSSGARSAALCLELPLVSYVVWANSNRPGKTAQLLRFAWAFAVRLCDKQSLLIILI